ncbi:hypothetical protein OSB04_013139 [Centaurea solstitialis]|uniref:20 kDa chaperonin, chloroplastic n=1 Tax=Centaurea solstitialis TaxID=347529 RepID=A0AA38TCN4_9ASTR|nr:hypothetical protein OSB04_013139 [Centaurea solstitialis]
MPMNESAKKVLKISLDSDHAKCSICLNIWHDVVTVAPCLHNFCNGCFSEWLRRSQEKQSSVLCPHCRAVVQFVGRNHFLHNIEEEILQSDSSLRRSDEELAVLNSSALIKSPFVINNGKKTRRKRSRLQPEEDSNVVDLACAQCGTEYAGFQCNQNTVHLQCHACGGMMPSRTNARVPQHCIGCDRAFCGAYWHSQQVTRSDSYHTCALETFKPISERVVTRIPYLAHERNRHEQDITERCIRQMGKTLQNVVSEWITKLNNREIDRTRMPLNHTDMITAETHICNDCFDKLVSFLLYWFRISLPKYLLPGDALQREDCWYGYTCRTQHHNEDHARLGEMAAAQLNSTSVLPSFEGLRSSSKSKGSSVVVSLPFRNLSLRSAPRGLVVKSATTVAPKYTSLKPLGDRVLLKIKAAEEKSIGGILLPSSAQTKPQAGEVVAVGEGRTIGEKKVDIGVKTGTPVVYSKYSGTEIEFDGSNHLILKEDDIVGILETDDIKDLKPLNDRVLIKAKDRGHGNLKIEEAEETTAGGLLLTQASKEKPSIGKVIAVGPGPLDEEGNRTALPVSAGNTVLYSKYAGNDFKGTDGSEYIALRSSDVMAVLS